MTSQASIPLAEVRTKVTPFERELLGMIPNARFVHDSRQLKLSEQCGYMPRKNFIAFTYDFPRLSHEIAHMVEMRDFNRLLKDDWGLSFDNDFRSSISKFNRASFTFAASARECRVKAIESFLCKSQYPSGRILHENWYTALHNKVSESSYGRFQKASDINEWLMEIFKKTQSKWSLDRIKTEWSQRIFHIRNWQETNASL